MQQRHLLSASATVTMLMRLSDSQCGCFYRFHAPIKEVRQPVLDDAKEFDLVHVINEPVVEDAVDLVDPQADEFVPVLQSKQRVNIYVYT